jgi:hypothetical protein
VLATNIPCVEIFRIPLTTRHSPYHFARLAIVGAGYCIFIAGDRQFLWGAKKQGRVPLFSGLDHFFSVCELRGKCLPGESMRIRVNLFYK